MGQTMAETASASATEKRSILRKFERREIIIATIVGFVAGALAWLAKMGLDKWVMDPLFCKTPDTFAVCQNAGSISYVVALVLVGILAVSVMHAMRLYRPLLIAVAALASIWGIATWLGPLVWWQATLWDAVIVALSFLLFGLVAQIRRFGLSFFIMLALVVAFQFVVKLI